MSRADPKKTRQYGVAFKRTAVQLSQRPGIQVQAVAEALDLHPFMLSRWRKEFREGRLRPGTPTKPRAPKARLVREIRRLQELERAHQQLQEEHALLKNSSGSPPHKTGRLRVHRPAAGDVRGDAPVSGL